MDRRHLAVTLAFLGAVLGGPPRPAEARQFEIPTAEEYAERAAKAEAAPLFQSHDPIRITLTTDIEWLVDERNDSVEVDGTATFVDLDGSEVTRPVQVRARGNFRRDRKNCNFPPLRLDFPTGQMEGTVFEGQDKLKLVTPCNDGRDAYQNYVFDEYLAYRAFQTVTPYSFRVRPVEITYVDVEDDYRTRTKHAFLIEDEVAMAERNGATMVEATQFHPLRMDGPHAVTVAMFNYMIANSDWSPVYFHNSKLIRLEDGRHLTVPYDFDWSGIVNPRYATPDPKLNIRNVRQRVYRGFCRPELTYDTAVGVFRETREAIRDLYEGFAALGYADFDADDARDALRYLEDFYEVVDDPDEFEDEIVENCRSTETG
jgi:hypothetical protein